MLMHNGSDDRMGTGLTSAFIVHSFHSTESSFLWRGRRAWNIDCQPFGDSEEWKVLNKEKIHPELITLPSPVSESLVSQSKFGNKERESFKKMEQGICPLAIFGKCDDKQGVRKGDSLNNSPSFFYPFSLQRGCWVSPIKDSGTGVASFCFT